MFKKMEHFGIMVSDMDRSVQWYTTVLGLKLRQRVNLSETTELAFLTVGESEIELIYKKGPFSYPLDGVVNHLAFTVTDLDAIFAHLKEQKVTMISEAPVTATALGARIAFFRGPDGEKLELVEHQS